MDQVTAQMAAPPVAADLRQRVVDRMIDLLPTVLKRDVVAVTETTGLFTELGLSSTTTLELLLELEDRLEIQIDVEEIDQDDLTSVGTLAEFISTHSTAD